MSPSLIHEIVKHIEFWSGIGAAVAGVFKVIAKYIVKPMSEFLAGVRERNQIVQTLATNHIPHMEQALTSHTEALAAMKIDMAATRVELGDVKTSVQGLNEAFINHLENAAKASTGAKHGV